MSIPRILIAAPGSGSGKTLLTCALLGALREDGKKAVSFKCGPDYIDPMFHRTVLQIPSENLDTFFSGEAGTREMFEKASAGCEIAVMEGVMGLYDGLGGVKEEASAYHLAKVTDTPILLAADVRGMGRSAAALIKGFLDYDSEHLIRGILLNRTTEGLYKTLKPLIEAELKIPVVGYFPERKDMQLESRHLGLHLPQEIEGIREHLREAAAQLRKTGGYEQILAIAREAAEGSEKAQCRQEKSEVSEQQPGDARAAGISGDGLILAAAKDEAFCFYYEANLRMFKERGVKIVYFSPLKDEELPPQADGLLLPGGYPELYARQLSKNMSMRSSIRRALEKGLPSLAECGGFMYLHEKMETAEGEAFPMAGVIPGTVSFRGKLVRFGYAKLSETETCFLPAGETIRGHEFHYFDSTDNGACCTAVKPVSGRSWPCVHEGENHFWGFPHLYYPSAPAFAEHFVLEMRKFAACRRNKNEK